MNRLVGLIIALVTGFLNYLAIREIATHFHSVDPVFIAAAMMATVVIHELGHLAFLEFFGVKTFIFFAVILGGACPLDMKRYKALSWNKQTAVLLAGVSMNMLLIVLTLIFGRAIGLTPMQCDRLINLQSVIIVWNLLPLPMTDGSKFLKILFDSVPENKDASYAMTIRVVGYAGALAVLVAGGLNYLLGALLLSFMAGSYATHDDPNGSHSPLAMTRVAERRWTAYYLGLLIVGMWISAFTYHWLA